MHVDNQKIKYEFRRQLEYKTQLYGSKLFIVDRFYHSSKTCSNCGIKKESLLLSEPVFDCEQCGTTCDREQCDFVRL
ncbi:transposase [Nostoc sp.]|uniref:transposase n=1 Tax=Nostoc sp. TaxID=1180 RepID=UPI002FF6B41E